MKNPEFGVMIIAAEKETKALWPVLDKPIIGCLLKTILECEPEGVAVAIGQEDDALCKYLKSFPSLSPILHDSSECREWWKRFSHVLVLGCDLPFLRVETVRSFMSGHIDSCVDCSFLGNAPYALIFDPGRLVGVPAQLAGNVSMNCLSRLASLLDTADLKTRTIALDACEAPAILDRTDLAEAAARMRNAIVLKWMEKGVHIMDPRAVWIGPDVELESGVSLMPGAQIWGSSFVGEGSVVGPYCILRNAVLRRGVNLVSNVIVENSELLDYASAGPFTYIREHSVLKERSYAGKFVEIKKTTVGSSSKVPHLSYMGDAILGENVNIGAGSITCNYDGVNKHQTRIGDRCFVGSDTMMVAPVTLGDDSVTGAGSTITTDVPPGALAVGRARQKNLEAWGLKKKQVEK